MQGVYTASYDISAVTARTLMYITAASTCVVKILKAVVTMRSDAAGEQVACGFQRVTTLGTPTATTVTPVAHENASATAASTVRGNVTASEPTYNTSSTFDKQGITNTLGFLHAPVEEEDFIYIPPSATVGLKFLEAATTAPDVTVTITFRELG